MASAWPPVSGGRRDERPSVRPCVRIMTAGFTGRCRRGDEERRALARAAKTGSGSYDDRDKLGLAGRHDDGTRHCDAPLAPVMMAAGVWELWRQYGDDRVSIRYLKRRRRRRAERRVLLTPLDGWMGGGGLRQIHTVIQMVGTLRPLHKQDYYPNKFSLS